MRVARVIAAFLLTLALFWIAPPQLRLGGQSEFLDATLAEYLFDHQTVQRARAEEPVTLTARVTTPRDTSEFRVVVVYRLQRDSTWHEVYMPLDIGSFDSHSATLPAGKKGSFFRYHLELRDKEGNLLARLPDDPKQEIRIAFVGQVPVWLRAARIGSLFLGTMFAWLSLFNALALRQPQVRLPRLAKRVFVTTLLLPLGGIVLNAAVKYASRGFLWNGWPLGRDVEQTAWLIACLYWIGLTLVMLRNIFALKTGKRKVMAGLVTLSVAGGFALVLFAYLTGV